MADPKPGLFSGLSLRRPSASPATIAHPLLGASTTSLVPDPHARDSDAESTSSRSPETGLPYKPRQRVASAANNTAPSGGTSPNPQPSAALKAGGSTSGDGASASAPAGSRVPSGGTAPAGSRTTPESPGTQAPPAPPTITTTTTFAPSPDDGGGAGAAGRLQLQSLKAAAQRIGLNNGSMGMGMVDAIFEKGARARADGDWADLLKVLTSGKTIILLPASPASSLPMTPQTLRDHIAFLSPPLPSGRSTAAPTCVLVTLSGLIGTLRGTAVTFESSIPPDSPQLTALRDEVHRASVLGRRRPTQLASPHAQYPSYTLSGESTSLPFPPLGKGGPPVVEKKADARRMNPFMSLFGSSSHAGTPRTSTPGGLSPERPASPSGGSALSSPRPSVVSLNMDDDHAEGYNVTAYVLDKPVRYAEVHKGLVKAVRSAVRSELDGLPDRVVDKVLRFVVGAVCPTTGSIDHALLKSHHHGLGHSDSDVPLDFSDPHTTGERLQDFMEGVYDDLVQHYRSESPKKWADKGEKGREVQEQYIEEEASDGTERVEAVICRLLHNRIFSPLNSDDARHDEALASRVAALNLLDLSLDHLGLITRPADEADKGAIARGLSALVDDIGRELQKLSTIECLTPKDKADVLVHAHKIAVDGLTRLPPIELRPEGEPYRPEGEQEVNDDEGLDTITEMGETPAETPGETPAVTVSDPEGDGTELSEAPVLSEVAEPEKEQEPENEPEPKDDAESEKPTEKEAEPEQPAESEKQALSADSKTAPPRPSTSGADLILPIIIFAVVKANPPQLASQLMYLRRYRSAICLAGEASYAIVNLTAVVEFLEHVQLSELGLGDASTKVMSVDDLAPIGLGEISGDAFSETESIASASSRLRGRVFQVHALAGSAADSANKVITGVVDSGISALRGFMGGAGGPTELEAMGAGEEGAVGPRGGRPRQASTFSLASVTASVANIAAAASTAAARTRSRASSHGDGPHGQELVEVPAGSKPASLKPAGYSDGESESDDGGGSEREREQAGDRELEAMGDEGHAGVTVVSPVDDDHDDYGAGRNGAESPAGTSRPSRARSIVSVSSMMRDSSRERGQGLGLGARGAPGVGGPGGPGPTAPSIGARLSSIGARLAESSPGTSTPTPLPPDSHQPPPAITTTTNSGNSGTSAGGFFANLSRNRRPIRSPSGTQLSAAALDDGPMECFMTCEVGDIRLHEVGVLLRDYRRLAGVVARLQGGS